MKTKNLSLALFNLLLALAVTTVNADTLDSSNVKHTIVTASSNDSYDRSYSPLLAIDKSLSSTSRWSSKGYGVSMTLDLGSVKNIEQIRTAWFKGNVRTAYFDIDTSMNGSTWTNVLSGASAYGTKDFITFDVQKSVGRYIKIIGQGNSSSRWNSLVEIEVYGDSYDNSNDMENLNIVNAFSDDEYDRSYSPLRTLDGSLNSTSRWSSKGLGKSITLDLGSLSVVKAIDTAWFRGDSRQAYFDVQSSVDNSRWTTVLANATATGSLNMIRFDVVDSSARYVKITGNGNSSSLWNSITEIDIYGTPSDEPVEPVEPRPVPNDSIALIQSLFDLEGGDENLDPYRSNDTLVFDALQARHVTPSGNGWRHEYKMAIERRLAMSETSEDFGARITPVLSTGSKTIVAQYHGGDTGTLVKVYVSDTNESRHDDSVANNGIFDVYARLRTDDSESETILNFGTIRSGQSFDLVLTNRRGLVYVSALGVEDSMRVSDSDGAYLKFGNYLQAQDAETGKDIEDSSDWADFYSDARITQSQVTFSNINYVQY